jgi:undecaprenyl-diphosphatase
MNSLDRELFLAINHGWNSGFNDYWLGYATWLGNGWIAFPIAIVALILLDRSAFWRNAFALAIAGIAGGVALNVIKQAVHAPRPLTVFAPDLAAGRVYINVMFDKLYYYSFPSGHSQTIFTVATVLLWAGIKARKINFWGGTAILMIAMIVGISRIYCGAHFPSDVLAGAVLGTAAALPSCYAVGRWQKNIAAKMNHRR